jgi:hypothetical protein
MPNSKPTNEQPRKFVCSRTRTVWKGLEVIEFVEISGIVNGNCIYCRHCSVVTDLVVPE